jgi:hypothetical protein
MLVVGRGSIISSEIDRRFTQAYLAARRCVPTKQEDDMKKFNITAITLALFVVVASAAAQTKVYTEGQVTEISYIKIKPGKFDEYMSFLDTNYKALMEANKKAGLVVSYAVYSSRARSPQEPDLLLSVTYQNMAALDKIEEGEAIAAKVVGSTTVQNKQYADRQTMREVLGSQLIRELVLK